MSEEDVEYPYSGDYVIYKWQQFRKMSAATKQLWIRNAKERIN
jgi:hypothetical protein